jgi:hypothetical protein
MWSIKGYKRHPLLGLYSFYQQRPSLTFSNFQKNKTTSILKQIVVAREAFFRLGALSSFPPIFLYDMLQMTCGGFRT